MATNEFSLVPYIRKLRVTQPVIRECIGEFMGTLTMMVFGNGVLAQVVLGQGGPGKEHGGFLSISLGWGFAVYMGVFVAGKVGKGLINPAVTVGFALIGRVKWRRVPFYLFAQYFGAFVGSLLVFLVYMERIRRHGETQMEMNGYYDMMPIGNVFVTNRHNVSVATAFWDQTFGTIVLAAGALTIVDKNNFNPPEWAHPLTLAFMVYALVGCFALNAGAALNPARDMGPRIMLALCGWKGEAFTYGDYYFWVPAVAPYLGAIIGAVSYELLIGNQLAEDVPPPVAASTTGPDHHSPNRNNNALQSGSSSRLGKEHEHLMSAKPEECHLTSYAPSNA